jgi:hypothetical protein
MAINVSEWVWEFSRSTGTTKLVLLAIADHADPTGDNAFPSVARLCARTGLSERTIHAATRELVRLGELEIDRHGGRRGTNLYRIWMWPGTDAPQDLREEPQDSPDTPQDPRGADPAGHTEDTAPDTADSAEGTADPAVTPADEQPQDLHPSPADPAPEPPQDLRGEPSLNRPLTVQERAPAPEADRRDPAEELDDAAWRDALVAELLWLRPDWRETTIGYALRPPFVARHTRAEIRQAFVAVARDPAAQSPGAAAHDSPVWRARLDLPPYRPWCRCCDMPSSRQVRSAKTGEVGPCPTCHPAAQNAATREATTE